MRHQKPRSGDDAIGSGVQRPAGVGAGGDPAGEEDGPLTGRRSRVWQKVERRHGSDQMAAGLSSLGDQTVSAPTDCLSRLSFGTDHHEDEDSGVAQMLDDAAIAAERHHYDIDVLIDADRDVATTDEVHQQVHRDCAPRGLRANVIDRRSQLTGPRQSQGAQAARFRHRRGQWPAGQTATHSGLTDRDVKAKSIRDVQRLTHPGP